MSLFIPILIHELGHFLLTGLISFFIWKKFKNPFLILVSFILGLFIDVDHFFDYFFWAGWSFNLLEFIRPELYVHGTNKVFVFFHGWEYLLLLYLVGRKNARKMPGLIYALTIPYFAHLLIDQLSGARSPLAYFFLFRLINNFSLGAFNG